MREYHSSSMFKINDETWHIRMEYDEYPDVDDSSQIAYAIIGGPNDEAFEYEFHYTKHIMRSHRYLLSHMDDRAKHAMSKTKSFLKKQSFKNLVITISPKGTDVKPRE